MSDAFTIPSPRQPVTEIGPNGVPAFTRPWFLFFQNVRALLGGGTSGSIDDVQQSPDGDSDPQLAAEVYALTDEVRVSRASEMNEVRAELAELKKIIQGMQQGTTL